MAAPDAGLRAKLRRNRGQVVFLALIYVGCVVLLVILGESWIPALLVSVMAIGLVLLRDLMFRRDIGPPPQAPRLERAQLFRQPGTDRLADKVAPLTDTETVVDWLRKMAAGEQLFIDRSWGTVCVSKRNACFDVLLSDGDHSWFATGVNSSEDDTFLLPDTERLVIDAMRSSDRPTATAWRPIS